MSKKVVSMAKSGVKMVSYFKTYKDCLADFPLLIPTAESRMGHQEKELFIRSFFMSQKRQVEQSSCLQRLPRRPPLFVPTVQSRMGHQVYFTRTFLQQWLYSSSSKKRVNLITLFCLYWENYNFMIY